MTRVFGITGRMGAGKSWLAAALADSFHREGIPLLAIEVDSIRRFALWESEAPRHAALRRALASRFSLPASGRAACLDRAALARAVFADRDGLAVFRETALPTLRGDICQCISGAPGPVALVWAMLAEDGLAGLLSGPLILVTSPEAGNLERLRPRDGSGGLSLDEIRQRLALQPSDADRIAAAVRSGDRMIVFDNADGAAKAGLPALLATLLAWVDFPGFLFGKQ